MESVKKYSAGIDWISGIEISSGLPAELGGKPTSNFHIVGLFVNPFNKALLEYCEKMQKARLERMEKMVENLQGLGFKITADGCLKESEGETINRPHIVSALKKNPENLKIIEALKVKMKKEGEKNPEIMKKYLDILKKGEKEEPYALFLDKNSYIKGIYVDYLYGLQLDETVQIIRNAGGVAFLAHWSFCKKFVPIEIVGKLLEEKRIDGTETVYNPNRRQGLEKEFLSDMSLLENLAEKYSCLRSGGSDSHSENDFKDFFSNPNVSGKTVGLTENIIKGGKIDLQWSSFKS